MDGYAPKIALGLGLRHDWGPQYTAHQFQGELAWLGIRSTASYVGEPECNGVAERFMRTLKGGALHLGTGVDRASCWAWRPPARRRASAAHCPQTLIGRRS